MNIPDKVKIGACFYEVLTGYNFDERDDIRGQADHDLLEIRIKDLDTSGRPLPPSVGDYIFVHEVLHCINAHFNNGELGESAVERLARGLHQFIVDNPGVFGSNQGDGTMPAKLERCVKKVRAKARKSGKKVNPWAVCSKSTGIKRKKGGGWTKGKK